MNQRARTLRKNQTDAEQRLWRHLRNRELEGHKFRRQHPIGRYVVDFVCTERCLVVEVDGGQHDEQRAYDSVRTSVLEAAGYRVLRFWNHELLQETEAVLEVIRTALRDEGTRGFAATPSSQPSPPVGEKEPTTGAQSSATTSSSLSPAGGEGQGEGDR